MIVLWIDPGTTTIGFAILSKNNNIFELIDYGIFKTTPKIDLSIKLLEIWSDIKNIIETYNPDIIVVEKLFFQTNLKTGIDVASARWVILYEIIKANKRLLEYTPLQVKKAITWNGSANKLQLQKSIKMILKMRELPKPNDAADAIWLAYMWVLNNNLIF